MTLNRRQAQLWIVAGLIILLLVTDQAIKIWVKTHMFEQQKYDITSWFKIYFIENEGMAYGITLGSKLFLTFFRIIAMSLAVYFVNVIVKKGIYKNGFIVSMAMIVAGGIGNIIDSVFYGPIFTSSVGQVAHWVPWGQGYAPAFYGKVVDMFYFPLIHGTFPDWIPFKGGENFIFFSPIFNFADACISVGVITLILFYPHTLGHALDSLSRRKKSADTEQDNKD